MLGWKLAEKLKYEQYDQKLKLFLYYTVFNIDLFAVARHKKICDDDHFHFFLTVS